MEVYQSRPLLPIVDISLSDDSQVNGDLSLAVLSAAQEFSTLFSLSPPAGIRPVSILYGRPRTVSTPDITRYKVYLFVTNHDYRRLVYQLGHELCHIFADPRRSNWFVESCCAMASTVLLCRMSKLWLNALRADWRSYAHKFQQYSQYVIRRARQSDQPDARQGQVLNAEILLPLFDQLLENWNALCFLGQASTSPPGDLTDWDPTITDFSFDRWLQAVPDYLKGIVRRISNTPEDLWDYRL